MKVLTYHRVDSIDSDPLTIKTEMFLRHLDYLEDRGFNFISPEDLRECTPGHSHGMASPNDHAPYAVAPRCMGKRTLLTFNHGFSSDYKVIYPLLKAKKYRAIFFLVTDYIGKEGMLRYDEIRSLRRSGFTIGSHTISHPHLTRIPLDQARREIEGSKKILEDLLGETIDFFSYPYGDLNEDIINLVKEAGYKAAFLTKPRGRKIGHATPINWYCIPGCGIYQNTNFFIFKLKML